MLFTGYEQQNEISNAMNIKLFGLKAEVLETNNFSNLVEQAWLT